MTLPLLLTVHTTQRSFTLKMFYSVNASKQNRVEGILTWQGIWRTQNVYFIHQRVEIFSVHKPCNNQHGSS